MERGGYDELLLTDASGMASGLDDPKDQFEGHNNYKGQGFEITGFESIRQDSGTWSYQGDFMSSDVVIAGGIAQFELTEPVSSFRAKRFHLRNYNLPTKPALHFDISALLDEDMKASQVIRFRMRRLAKANNVSLGDKHVTLLAADGSAPMKPDDISDNVMRWDLISPDSGAAMEVMSEEDHSMDAMQVDVEPDQSIYRGIVGRTLILTSQDIFG